ncbi:MAG: RNA polymerase sigma factor [Planctomycetota bacterium]
MTGSRTPAGPDLQSLAAAVRAGNAEALNAWFRLEHPRVFRLCFGFLADHAEAEDLAQDAMLHLHDRLAAWDPGRSYRTWGTAVVLNLCRDRLRRLQARRRAEDAARERPIPLRLPRPAETAQRNEVRAVLAGVLGRLTPREREVFVLHDLEETPAKEVSAALGITPATVRSILSLARRRLRALLGDRLAGVVPGQASGGSRA